MHISHLISTAIFGFFLAKCCAGKIEGDGPQLRVQVQSYYVHLHHWLIAAILMICLRAYAVSDVRVYGLLLGIMLQGLSYSDWYRIIYKK